MTYDFVVKIMENDLSAYDLIEAVKTETLPKSALLLKRSVEKALRWKLLLHY